MGIARTEPGHVRLIETKEREEGELHNREKKKNKHYFAWTHGGIIHCEVPL